MRILIIATVRTGGFQLGSWLANEMGYKFIHEPRILRENIIYHIPPDNIMVYEPLINSKLSTRDNIVVKYLVNDYEELTKYIDIKSWDKIIGIFRKNKTEAAESFVKAYETQNWHTKHYKITDSWLEKNKHKIEEYIDKLEYHYAKINDIKEIELMVTYEGIYNTKEDIQKIIDYVEISKTKYDILLNNTNRMRNDGVSAEKLI